ncbi:MAG TPA: cob(I)yrinic acid a,c-diamide adenosyltransferase [Lentisphaeria bacterium]|nr:MAG: cob(I)yrinic acid a,c-diamide adenosyltransferase [Lentisphaerae bacterium GWF2_38_69]HBM15757.1 cob(I)yrinic acid a,c-diamide adenosyltransferase [Lentisphaeria bacterium]
MKGLVQLYTGNGKGKTTSAFGLALRASGHGKKNLIAQFMKGTDYGENISLKGYKNIDILQFGWKECIRKDEVREFYKSIIEDGLGKCLVVMLEGKYDIVILDEIIVSVWFGLVDEKKLIEFIDSKPFTVELILTGRYASEALIEKADLVTEMREVKHPYGKGTQARKGIEF